jgi:hypothetical protein|tara:strand:+ start:11550 stop:11843 length:294 start_codon:yes stop_codon:yes gene_type:complete
MENFKIQKNIPIPEDIRGSSSQRPWDKMEVGDSVFIPLKENDNAQRAKNRLQQSTRTFCKKHQPDWKFVLRYRLEEVSDPSNPTLVEVSGIRVWRIA